MPWETLSKVRNCLALVLACFAILKYVVKTLRACPKVIRILLLNVDIDDDDTIPKLIAISLSVLGLFMVFSYKWQLKYKGEGWVIELGREDGGDATDEVPLILKVQVLAICDPDVVWLVDDNPRDSLGWGSILFNRGLFDDACMTDKL